MTDIVFDRPEYRIQAPLDGGVPVPENSILEENYDKYLKILKVLEDFGYVGEEDLLTPNVANEIVKFGFAPYDVLLTNVTSNSKEAPEFHASDATAMYLLSFSTITGITRKLKVSGQAKDIFKHSGVKISLAGWDTKNTISLLQSFNSIQWVRLDRLGIDPTPKKIIHLWALERMVNSSWALAPSNSFDDKDKILRRIYAMIYEEIDIYVALQSLTQYANPKFADTREFEYSIESLKNLSGLPYSFVDKTMWPYVEPADPTATS